MCGGGVGVGLAEQGDQPGAAGVGDPGLGAVHHIAVRVLTGDRAHRLEVGAAARFGQRHGGPDLAGGHLRQIAALLLLGAEAQQEGGDHGVAAHRTGQTHPATGKLLGDQDITRSGDGGAAVLLGDGEPEDTELFHPLDQGLGVGVGVLQLPDDRFDVVVHEVAHHPDDEPLVLGHDVEGAHALTLL